MRFLVFSDAHGDTVNFIRLMELHPEADSVIFLGDGTAAIRELSGGYKKPFYIVKGNCDFFSDEPLTGILEAEGKIIAYTHGHLFHVKDNIEEAKSFARLNGADVLLFGHTHVPLTDYDDGLYILNPGSVAKPDTGLPSYGMLDITPAGIVTVTAQLR